MPNPPTKSDGRRQLQIQLEGLVIFSSSYCSHGSPIKGNIFFEGGLCIYITQIDAGVTPAPCGSNPDECRGLENSGSQGNWGFFGDFSEILPL